MSMPLKFSIIAHVFRERLTNFEEFEVEKPASDDDASQANTSAIQTPASSEPQPGISQRPPSPTFSPTPAKAIPAKGSIAKKRRPAEEDVIGQAIMESLRGPTNFTPLAQNVAEVQQKLVDKKQAKKALEFKRKINEIIDEYELFLAENDA